jgi:6-phosphogluconolactonase
MRFGSTELEIAPTPDAVAERAAELTLERYRAAIAARGSFSLALSGGSTPRLYHQVLASKYQSAIDWTKVLIFFSDDRAVAATHKDSNYRMAEETLISCVPLPRANVFRIEADEGDHVRAAMAYDETLARVLGRERIVDVVMLGMGEDGHTASLFPGLPPVIPKNGARNDAAFVVPAEAPPTSPIARRVTFSFRAIAAARNVIAMITGAAKAARLRQVLTEKTDLPMARVARERASGTVFIVDRAAAAEIEKV